MYVKLPTYVVTIQINAQKSCKKWLSKKIKIKRDYNLGFKPISCLNDDE